MASKAAHEAAQVTTETLDAARKQVAEGIAATLKARRFRMTQVCHAAAARPRIV